MYGLILAAGGTSSRFGGRESKVLVPLRGRPVLAWALDAFFAVHGDWDVVIAAHASLREAISDAAQGRARVVVGGTTRQASVAAGLAALHSDADPILVHDAARPLVSPDVITRVLEAIARDGAAGATLPAVDSLHRIGPGATLPTLLVGSLDRTAVVHAQTPQGATRDALVHAFLQADDDQPATDEIALLRASGVSVTAVLGDPSNIKITTRDDLEIATRYLKTDA